jgi:hypothetical protein
MYEEAIAWGNDPLLVVVTGDDDPADRLPDDRELAGLPRQADRQGFAWRVRMARAFTDIATDLEARVAPVAHNHAEALAFMITCSRTRNLVKAAREAADARAEELPEESAHAPSWFLSQWIEGLGTPIDLARAESSTPGAVGSFTLETLEDALTGEAGLYMLWTNDTGLEHPEHPENQRSIGEDLRPESWFDDFAATTIHRDPARGYPPEVWERLPEHVRRALDLVAASDAMPPEGVEQARELDRLPRRCRCTSPSCPRRHGAGPPLEDRPLGEVRASTAMRSGWRQQVLTRSVRDCLNLSPEDTGLDQDSLWNKGLATVLSDVPQVALAQLHRYLPGASQDRAGDVVEVMWARPTLPEEYVDASWFRVRVWDIREHSAGSADHPWMRVVWGDGAVSGMSLTDIVAIRKATTSDLTPMTVPDSIPARRAPAPTDYDGPGPLRPRRAAG